MKTKYGINLPKDIAKAKNLDKYITNVFEYAAQKEKSGEKIKHINLNS